MILDAATAPTQPETTLSEVVGFGSTSQETTKPIGRKRRPMFVTSGTIQHPTVEPSRSILASQSTEAYIRNLLSTVDGDAVTVRWDQLHGQLFFHSPILVGNAPAVKFASSPFSPQYEPRIRMLILPIRWQLGAVLEAHTSEWPKSWTATLASTDPLLAKSDYLQQRVSELFATAAEETFEEGSESPFVKRLVAFITDHGDAAVATLESTLESGRTNVDVAREVLCLLGAANHSQSRQYRRAVLEKHLKTASARLRYAAALGLAEMDDPAAIPALAAAIRTEAHDKIRWHFQLVLDQLEDTKRCLSS